MKCSIIIPFYRNYETIENLLRSISDQDYKDYDVTIVVDGKDDKAKQLLEPFIEEYNIYLDIIEKNGGASVARNLGAKQTDGEILFFIDADCELYPGMLRECIEQLDDNPDIDFVYGNYRFENLSEFHSQGFDPYQLETMNYISTMSPLRRKAFDSIGGFNEDLEFFQDWDLFYTLAKNGYKGKFINEFIFQTKLSDEGNISGSKGMTLAEKAKKFREWHGIKDKSIVCTTFSAPLQAIQRAKMIGADYVGGAKDSRRELYPMNLQFDNWKATYMVGVFNAPIQALANHLNACIGKPILHFIGTDVYQLLTKHHILGLRDIREGFNKINAHLLVNSKRMQSELKECGIDAELLYTPIADIKKYEWADYPSDFTVGVYFSDTNQMHMVGSERSNLDLILDVARSTPTIKYKFFGGNAKYNQETIEGKTVENIEFCGRIPEDKMVEFIHSCSCILRSTQHDGFPQLPIQFLLCGRNAIVSVPDEEFKFAKKLSFEHILNYEENKSEMIEALYVAKGWSGSGYLLAKNSYEYYNELMNEDRFRKRIYEIANS